MSPGDTPPSFGRFQLMQVVRHDGATTLHDAFDAELGHQVALITSPAGPETAEEGRLAFRLRRMRHPNIVSVLDTGRQDNVAFVAAECLDTEPLSAFLARAGRIPVFQGLALVLQLLSAIEHAQARGMGHAAIDLEHVQVTPGGQLKLPAGGWSLSSDRQPNLEAAARIAQVLLCGACPPHMRRALDEVLLRAQGPDPEARFRRADEFTLALLAAAGRPVWRRTPAMERAVLAESGSASPVPVSKPSATHALGRAPRKPLHRRLPGRNLVAACLVAALLVPHLIGDGTFTGSKDAPGSGVLLPLGASTAPVAPARVALAPVAAASPVEPSPVPPSPVAPSPTAPSIDHAAAVAPPSMASQPVARTAIRQRATRARPTPSARQARATKPATTRARAARPRIAPALTAASGCPYDPRIARDLCKAQQCSRTELRHHPVCVRMRAEQRAALARLRGTPD